MRRDVKPLYDFMADTIGYIQVKMRAASLQLARTHARFTHCMQRDYKLISLGISIVCKRIFQNILTFCRFKARLFHMFYSILVSFSAIVQPFIAMNKRRCMEKAKNSFLIRMCTCSSVNRNERQTINMLSLLVLRNHLDISNQCQH